MRQKCFLDALIHTHPSNQYSSPSSTNSSNFTLEWELPKYSWYRFVDERTSPSFTDRVYFYRFLMHFLANHWQKTLSSVFNQFAKIKFLPIYFHLTKEIIINLWAPHYLVNHRLYGPLFYRLVCSFPIVCLNGYVNYIQQANFEL